MILASEALFLLFVTRLWNNHQHVERIREKDHPGCSAGRKGLICWKSLGSPERPAEQAHPARERVRTATDRPLNRQLHLPAHKAVWFTADATPPFALTLHLPLHDLQQILMSTKCTMKKTAAGLCSVWMQNFFTCDEDVRDLGLIWVPRSEATAVADAASTKNFLDVWTCLTWPQSAHFSLMTSCFPEQFPVGQSVIG